MLKVLSIYVLQIENEKDLVLFISLQDQKNGKYEIKKYLKSTDKFYSVDAQAKLQFDTEKQVQNIITEWYLSTNPKKKIESFIIVNENISYDDLRKMIRIDLYDHIKKVTVFQDIFESPRKEPITSTYTPTPTTSKSTSTSENAPTLATSTSENAPTSKIEIEQFKNYSKKQLKELLNNIGIKNLEKKYGETETKKFIEFINSKNTK